MRATTRGLPHRRARAGTLAALLLLASAACGGEPARPEPDLAAPQVQLSSPAGEPVFTRGGVRITGTAADSAGVERVSVSVDGGPPRALPITPGRSVAFSDSVDLAPGTHTLTVAACDRAANCGERMRTVRVDRTGPRVSLVFADQRTSGGATQLFLRVAATDSSGLSLVRRSVNGAVSTELLSGSGWDRGDLHPLEPGANLIVFEVEDRAGNVGTLRLRIELADPAALAMAGFTACALDAEGRAYCWGEGNHGVLGDGSLASRSYARPVSGDQRFASLAAGGDHVCGLTADGRAFCWGQNYSGAVGDGSSTTFVTVPTAVSGGIRFRQLDASTYETCGLDLSGVAHCWGGSQGGLVDRTPRAVPAPVPFESVASGERFSCGVAASGQLLCWRPEARTAAPAAAGQRFRQVEIGGHWCGITLQDAVVCPDVERMDDPGPFRSLSLGIDQSCGVTTAGEIRCWSSLSAARTFHPSRTWSAVAQVGHRVGGGNAPTCGRATDGRTYCWPNHAPGEITRLMITRRFDVEVS